MTHNSSASNNRKIRKPMYCGNKQKHSGNEIKLPGITFPDHSSQEFRICIACTPVCVCVCGSNSTFVSTLAACCKQGNLWANCTKDEIPKSCDATSKMLSECTVCFSEMGNGWSKGSEIKNQLKVNGTEECVVGAYSDKYGNIWDPKLIWMINNKSSQCGPELLVHNK